MVAVGPEQRVYRNHGLEDLSKLEEKILKRPECPHKDPESPWEDPESPPFPPNMKFEWERYKDDAKFFVGGASAADIQQGRFGTCYFLAALAALAEEAPEKLQALQASVKGMGAFCIRWYPDGELKDTWVDNRYLKNEQGQTVCAHSEGHTEMWVALLEKAYAKVMGGYERIFGGSCADAFADLLGCPALEYNLRMGYHSTIWKALHEAKPKKPKDLESRGEIEYKKVACASVMGDPIHRFLTLGMTRNIMWLIRFIYARLHWFLTLCNAQFLVEYPMNTLYIVGAMIAYFFMFLDTITCGVIFGFPNGILFLIYSFICLNTIGLMPMHAYSILDVREVGFMGVCGKFVKLRNPWGCMEWKSWYSDKSVCWTLRPRLKKDFELKDENDGAFWMSLGDFVTYFDLMHVAHIDPQIVCKRAKAKLTERHAYFYFEVTPKQDGEEEDLIVYVSATQSRKNKDRRQNLCWKIRLFEAEKEPESLEDRGLCNGAENDHWTWFHHVCTPRRKLKPGKYCAHVNSSHGPLPSEIVLGLHYHKPSRRVRFCDL